MKTGPDVIIHSNCEFKHPDLVTIGNRVGIDYGFYCTTGLEVGDYVHISSHVSCIGGRDNKLIIGDFCFISNGARIITASEDYSGHGMVGALIPARYREIDEGDVVLEDFSGVATNSIVMPGVTLRQGAILGANSFLKEDAEEWTIYAGNPARPVKKRYPYYSLSKAKEITGKDY